MSIRSQPARAAREAPLVALLSRYFAHLDAGDRAAADALCSGRTVLARRLRELVAREAHLAPMLREPLRSDGAALPRRVARFRVEEVIGTGANSVVFRAVDAALGRRVALKMLHPACARATAHVERFRREARLAATVRHPCIVPLLETGDDRGVPFLVMPLIEGPTLAEVALPLPAAEVARLGSLLAGALHAVHEAAVMHRDVKPSNVVIDHGLPVLLDFGLAKAESDAALTDHGHSPGTLAYMSPEQLRGAALDPRSDVWSLGAVLAELATGRRVRTCAAILRRIDGAPRVAIGGGRQERALAAILERALAARRAKRFASARDFAAALDSLAFGSTSRSSPLRVPHS